MRNAFPVGPSFTSAAVKECPDKKKKKLRGERIYSAYSSGYNPPEVRKSKQELNQSYSKTRAEKENECTFAYCSAYFLYS